MKRAMSHALKHGSFELQMIKFSRNLFLPDRTNNNDHKASTDDTEDDVANPREHALGSNADQTEQSLCDGATDNTKDDVDQNAILTLHELTGDSTSDTSDHDCYKDMKDCPQHFSPRSFLLDFAPLGLIVLRQAHYKGIPCGLQ
jgi:hypothetical protein